MWNLVGKVFKFPACLSPQGSKISHDAVMNFKPEDPYRGAIKGIGKGQNSPGLVQSSCQNKDMLCPLHFSAMRIPCSFTLEIFGLSFVCYKTICKTFYFQSVWRRTLRFARSTPEADREFFGHNLGRELRTKTIKKIKTFKDSFKS